MEFRGEQEAFPNGVWERGGSPADGGKGRCLWAASCSLGVGRSEPGQLVVRAKGARNLISDGSFDFAQDRLRPPLQGGQRWRLRETRSQAMAPQMMACSRRTVRHTK